MAYIQASYLDTHNLGAFIDDTIGVGSFIVLVGIVLVGGILVAYLFRRHHAKRN